MRREDGHARPDNVWEWADLRPADLATLDPARTPVLVAFSPLEVHGPHLPLQTDFTEADELIYRAAARFGELHPEVRAVHLPPLYVAADVVSARGSLRFRPSTVRRVLVDLARTLSRQGFRHIWVANLHGGARHFVALEAAAHEANRRFGTRMISVFSALLEELTGGSNDLAPALAHIDGFTAENLEGDEHAGAIETSLMLHLRPDLVDPAFPELPRRTVALRAQEQGRRDGVLPGRPSPLSLFRFFANVLLFFDAETYAGHPALASAERGEAVLEVLARHAAHMLSEVWRGERTPEQCHSPLWPVRHLLLNETLGTVFERLAGRTWPPKV